jgi:negative regulator of sigma E activity
MSEEHPGERQAERDSQLSAMFDDELPAAECELLARRLARDEALRAQWSRYSLIGAALRAERGVALHDRVARRVQSAVAQEATYGDAAVAEAARAAGAAPASGAVARRRWAQIAMPVAGASIAAGVAAVSIFFLRGAQDPAESLQAANVAPSSAVVATERPAEARLALTAPPAADVPASNGEPERYSTPAPSSTPNFAPPARLANYVVAHSEYSGPLSRRMALLGIVGAEGEGVAVPEPSTAPDAAPEAADAP